MTKVAYLVYAVVVVLFATIILHSHDRGTQAKGSGYGSSGGSRGGWSGGAPRSK